MNIFCHFWVCMAVTLLISWVDALTSIFAFCALFSFAYLQDMACFLFVFYLALPQTCQKLWDEFLGRPVARYGLENALTWKLRQQRHFWYAELPQMVQDVISLNFSAFVGNAGGRVPSVFDVGRSHYAFSNYSASSRKDLASGVSVSVVASSSQREFELLSKDNTALGKVDGENNSQVDNEQSSTSSSSRKVIREDTRASTESAISPDSVKRILRQRNCWDENPVKVAQPDLQESKEQQQNPSRPTHHKVHAISSRPAITQIVEAIIKSAVAKREAELYRQYQLSVARETEQVAEAHQQFSGDGFEK